MSNSSLCKRTQRLRLLVSYSGLHTTQDCQKRFLRVQRNFLKETNLNLLIVPEFERKHLAGWMVKTALACPLKRGEEELISWKKPKFVIASSL